MTNLTKKEIQVLTRCAEGGSTKTIAIDLHLSYSTIRTHLHTSYRKLNVHDRAQAVIIAASLGLLGSNWSIHQSKEITDEMIMNGASNLPMRWSLKVRKEISQKVLTAALSQP